MLRKASARVRGMLSHRRLEEEFSEEVRAHLDMLAEEFEQRGMTPAEARLAARRSFGGVEQIREEHREARGLMHLERLAADLVLALRLMRCNPGFTAVAVLTLALGIGVNATLFSAYNAVALKPLSVVDPGGVYRLERWFEQRTGAPLSPAGRLLLAAADMPPPKLRRQLVVHVADPQTADGLQQWPPTRALVQVRLGPTALAVEEKDVAALTERLGEVGIRLVNGEGPE